MKNPKPYTSVLTLPGTGSLLPLHWPLPLVLNVGSGCPPTALDYSSLPRLPQERSSEFYSQTEKQK